MTGRLGIGCFSLSVSVY